MPRPSSDEALIRVLRAGICATDLEIVKGYMGFSGTLGHEFVGEVIECRDREWIGQRVTGEINLGCGICKRCLGSMTRHCATRTVLGILGKDGCFAEYVTLPVRNLHAVPEGVSDEVAAFVEPVAAAFEILEQLPMDPSWRVAVLGDGRLGAIIAMMLRHSGVDLTVIGRHARKLAHLEALGVRTATVGEPLDGDFDVVVEATGSATGFALARSLLRPRGVLVLKSTYHGILELDAAPLVIDEITVIGSRCGPFEPAIRALAAGRIDPSPLIDATYPLTDAERALEHAAERGVWKVQIVPHG